MHILLLSAYDTASHRAWCEGLMRNLPQFQWQYLSLPGRYFSWRIRGNPLSWAFGPLADQLKQDFDLIVATSMVDLATLRGLVPSLARTPAVLYFHENQFAYPDSPQQHKSLEPQMVNLYSALSAEHLVFNSEFNRSTFIAGVEALMKKLPDEVPDHLAEVLQNKSLVLPVPIEDLTSVTNADSTDLNGAAHTVRDQINLVWNHRWEYDKGPDTLLAVCEEIDQRKLNVGVWVLGQPFRQQPTAFKRLQQARPKCLRHIGKLESRQDYMDCLRQSDVVLSTAHHEFQGLAVLEAALAGCVPLVPDRLAYPEWVPESSRYADKLAAGQIEASAICDRLQHWLQHGLPAVPDVRHYRWNQLAPKYEKLLSESKHKSGQYR